MFRWTKETTLLAVVAGLVLLADQVSKYLVKECLPLGAAWAPVPALERWFTLTHTSNTGAAFGLFPKLAPVFLVIAIVVVIGIVLYSGHLSSGQYIVAVALGLQLGGALGNLVDRLRLDFKVWPVFNLADSALVVGVILLLWAFLWAPEQLSRPDSHPGAEGTTLPPADD